VGALTLPSTGSIYADVQILIYSVEKHPDYAPLLRPLWQAVQNEHLEVVSSELTLMEALIGPLKHGDTALASDYERLFQIGVRLLPITQPILRQAAHLRAAIPGLRTPDALHAATAMLTNCALLLTNDNGFRRIPGLSCVILNDVLNSP
jgi:predicted nucleic acid-binding protein